MHYLTSPSRTPRSFLNMMILMMIWILLTVFGTAAASDDSWNGILPITYYLYNNNDNSENCSSDENYWITGYTSSLQAMGDGTMCETDHLTWQGSNETTILYTKWVQVCGTPSPALSTGIYQYQMSCEDDNCTRCSETPARSNFVNWSYFASKPYSTCMLVSMFNANTIDPGKEFSEPPNTTISWNYLFGSEEIMMEYWNVFVNNSCIKDGPSEHDDANKGDSGGDSTVLSDSDDTKVKEGDSGGDTELSSSTSSTKASSTPTIMFIVVATVVAILQSA